MEVGLGESKSYNKHHCTECVCADVHCPGFVVLLGQIQHKQNSPSNQPASWQKQRPLPPVCPVGVVLHLLTRNRGPQKFIYSWSIAISVLGAFWEKGNLNSKDLYHQLITPLNCIQ